MIGILTGALTGALIFLALFTVFAVMWGRARRLRMMRCVWCGEIVSLDTERGHWRGCPYHPARYEVARLEAELEDTRALLTKLEELNA